MVPLLCCLGLRAQNSFLFIQHASGEPFYVRMGEKNFSSSASGHLILAGLTDSAYRLYLGFPGTSGSELMFIVPVQQKDRGFELKEMIGGWELFDLQTLQFIKAVPVRKAVTNMRGSRRTDTYTELMADVVNDSSVLYANANETLAVPAQNAARKDMPATTAPVVVKNNAVPAQAPAIPVADSTAVARPAEKTIIRFGSENKEEGREIIYLDRTSAVTDTIRILVPTH